MSVPLESSKFCLPSNLNVSIDFDFVSGNIETLRKAKQFPSGADIKCVLKKTLLKKNIAGITKCVHSGQAEKLLDCGENRTRDLWFASPMLNQLS